MFWFIPLRLFLWKLWGNLALIYAVFSLALLFFFLLVLRTEPQPHTWANATSELPSHLSSPFLFTWAMTVTVWGQELLASFSQRWDMRVYDWWLALLSTLQFTDWDCYLSSVGVLPSLSAPLPTSFTPPTWLLEIQVWMGKWQVCSQDVWFMVCLIKTAGL